MDCLRSADRRCQWGALLPLAACGILVAFLGRPRRLARPRTSPFHGGNTGSNPVGDANIPKDFRAPPSSIMVHFGPVDPEIVRQWQPAISKATTATFLRRSSCRANQTSGLGHGPSARLHYRKPIDVDANRRDRNRPRSVAYRNLLHRHLRRFADAIGCLQVFPGQSPDS
jgi:hypothetical protein